MSSRRGVGPLLVRTQTLPILGGQYTARVYSDGSADILRVPIFGELEPYARRNPYPIDEQWHRRAWQADRQLASQQYLPPVHVGHHDDGATTRRAGYFRIVDVRPALYRGRPQSTVFADFLRVPADVFARIQAGELPYVSAEICNWDRPEIASVALLSDEAPAFKFPLLTVGRVERAEQFRAHSVRYRFADFETIMPDQMPAPNPAAELPPWAPALAELIASAVTRSLNQPPPPDKASPVSPENLAEEPGDTDEQAVIDAAVGSVGRRFAQPKGDDEDEGVEDEEIDIEEDEERDRPEPFAERRVVALEAEVAALRAREAARLSRERTAARLARAQESLRGYQLDDATRATLAKFAERGDDVLNEFVEAFKRTAVQDPPETLAEYSRHQPTIEKFRSQGPEALEAAKRLLPQYEALRARRAVSVSFDDFVAANLNPYAPL